MRGPETPLIDRETYLLIDGAIDSLPERYRRVFVLADVEGRSGGAIAVDLGLILPAVKSGLHRARLLMRSALERHFGDIFR